MKTVWNHQNGKNSARMKKIDLSFSEKNQKLKKSEKRKFFVSLQTIGTTLMNRRQLVSFSVFRSSSVNQTNPGDLVRIFRYPPEDQRGVARAAEIYERTLDLVAEKVKKSLQGQLSKVSSTNFTYEDLVSPVNLELIANLSGCEAHRRQINCSQDLCYHAKYRAIDGSCNNFQNPLWGSSLTSFKRLLPAKYENQFNTPLGK